MFSLQSHPLLCMEFIKSCLEDTIAAVSIVRTLLCEGSVSWTCYYSGSIRILLQHFICFVCITCINIQVKLASFWGRRMLGKYSRPCCSATSATVIFNICLVIIQAWCLLGFSQLVSYIRSASVVIPLDMGIAVNDGKFWQV